jgi:S-adenosyl-L-methionine hydrolase (adenosine-forming)
MFRQTHHVLKQHWNVIVNRLNIPGGKTYSEVLAGNAIALVGSHGYVEIAIANGNACHQLQLELGTQVQVLIC